ncbi:hypothetical protein IGI04_036307, partial [Brassica rapa subsp. trilocularis]
FRTTLRAENFKTPSLSIDFPFRVLLASLDKQKGTSGIQSACAGAGKILLLHISFALLLCRLSPAFVLFSSLALAFSLSSRMINSAGYVASSEVIVGGGGWFPRPLRRRGDALPIPLKSVEYGTQFCFWLVKGYGGRCWEVILQYCHCLVPSLDGDGCLSWRFDPWVLLLGCYPCNTGGFHCVSWVPDLLFLKIGKRCCDSSLGCGGVPFESSAHASAVFGGEFRSLFVTKGRMCNRAFGCTRFIDREAYEFRQIHREPITLEVTPEVPTSEAR